MRVGKSKFCSLRPKWIKTITPHDGCACVYHQNLTLLITAWNRINCDSVDLKGLIVNYYAVHLSRSAMVEIAILVVIVYHQMC